MFPKLKNIMITVGVMLPVTSIAMANLGPSLSESLSRPVEYANCESIVTSPDNVVGRVIFSRDCKTIYVPPPDYGTLDFDVSLNNSILDVMCPTFELSKSIVQKKLQMRADINKQMSKLDLTKPSDEATWKRLAALDEELLKQIEDIKSPLTAMEGGKVSFSVSITNWKNLIEEYYRLNMNLVRDRGVRFMPLPLKRGYLSITNPKAPDVKNIFPSIISLNIGAAQLISEETGKTYYHMKTSATGNLVLGISKGCELYEMAQSHSNHKNTEEELFSTFNSEVDPHFRYVYETESTVGYSAALNSVQIVKHVLENSKFKSQFSISQVVDEMMTAALSGSFTFQIDLGSSGNNFVSAEARQNFIEGVREKVLKRLVDQLVEKMRQANLIDYTPAKPDDLIAPEPGNVKDLIGSRRNCKTKSFAGVRYSKSCWDEPIFRVVQVAGKASSNANLDQKFGGEMREDVYINENIESDGNVTFKKIK